MMIPALELLTALEKTNFAPCCERTYVESYK